MAKALQALTLSFDGMPTDSEERVRAENDKGWQFELPPDSDLEDESPINPQELSKPNLHFFDEEIWELGLSHTGY